jgi:hypothetical protein
MLSLHVEGKSLEELREKAGAILGAMVMSVAMAEQPVKRGPGRPKKDGDDPLLVQTPMTAKAMTKAVAPETVADSAPPVEAASAPAPVAIAPTLDNVRSLLQKVAASEKDVNKGMEKAHGLLMSAVGKGKLKELVEADYPVVIAAAEKLL